MYSNYVNLVTLLLCGVAAVVVVRSVPGAHEALRRGGGLRSERAVCSHQRGWFHSSQRTGVVDFAVATRNNYLATTEAC